MTSPAIPKPAAYPDLVIYPGDPPVSWKVTVRSNGEDVDLTNSTISAPVTDDGVQVATLTVEKLSLSVVQLTLTPEVLAAVKRYSTWRLREDTIFRLAAVKRYSTWRLREDTIFRFPLIQGRIVKEL